MTNLGRTNYQEEIKHLKTLLDSCSDEDRAIISSMARSTEAAKSLDPDEIKKKLKLKKQQFPKKKTQIKIPSLNYTSHNMSKRKKKIRASVRMGLTEDEFTHFDKVYLRTFSGRYGPAEYIIDRSTEKCLKNQSGYAVEVDGTRRILLHQIFPFVRNVRTQTNEVIAKRKHIGRPLVIERSFKDCYKGFLFK
ncbi:hypothetical protein QJV38_14240 [Listeria cossartiae subsp. cayugensis]|uniref:Uncharacterized protein n=1 Tax=Listeria cossartiae subsp. cayugensis TaxID=2713505 RepID=A0ABU2ISF2_9LIST|nr:hypothetical protein [Listeria cossartiae]MDT0067276.1 hypothetical protein [Listeria cossartiae subsp. cayugensis]MDT0081192.1 hypothetical protein [Listeria cossartiae subsp. cayugensis]MDT0084028.1 hypothetical protein [Listeria cossartiae subsp. cayugensis]MDT0089504.1 hypothetical protein [Listeria cossartiae subsp. cayugensis]MDT0100643.1 hypothetical protein [Listeria cossartiae subsp. cayugensis]